MQQLGPNEYDLPVYLGDRVLHPEPFPGAEPITLRVKQLMHESMPPTKVVYVTVHGRMALGKMFLEKDSFTLQTFDDPSRNFIDVDNSFINLEKAIRKLLN